MKTFLFLSAFALLVMSCGNRTTPEPTGTVQETTWELTEIWRTDTLLSTCESVLFDEKGNRLFVSCINGMPTDKNGQGFIAIVDLEGTITALPWVEGLNAPKGMGMYGNTLYVTDIDELVLIDIAEGKVIERLPVEGASFLNDIDISEDGKVYFSDSNTGRLWIHEGGETALWLEGFERPNGLLVEKERVLLTSSGSSDLRSINRASGTDEVITTEIGAGDGLRFTGLEGHYLVSSWMGEVFLVFPDGSKQTLLLTSDQEINSADFGYHPEKNVVYVPTFFDNRVVAYQLTGPGL